MQPWTEEDRDNALKKLEEVKSVVDITVYHDADMMSDFEQVLPGATLILNSPEACNKFTITAKDIFAQAEGDHRQGDGVKAEYSFAVKRLASYHLDLENEAGMARHKFYPVHIADAALKVLSQPENIEKIMEALRDKEADMKAGDDTVIGFKPRDGRPRGR